MSKQSKDQQPPSAPTSGSEQTSDGTAKPTGHDPKAAAASNADNSQPSSPADPSAKSGSAKADPIKPDVAQPATTGDTTGDTNVTSKPDAISKSGKSDASASNTAQAAAASGASAQSGSAGGKNGATAGKKSGKSGPATPSSGGAATPPGGTPPTAGKRGNGAKLGLLALVLVILLAIAVAIVGYLGWQKIQQQQTQLSQVGSNSTTLDQLESKVGELDQNRQQNLRMMRGEFDQYRQNLDNTLDKVLKELAQQQQADPREWLHAEAEYLLRLANQRLQLERDVEGAKALLNAADARLREADNPALVPIRRAIQSELASLDSVPVIDRTGLYLALMAQQEQLARLPLKQDIEEIAAGEGDVKPTGGWRQQLATLGSELKDLVTVRRHDQPLEALITPQQESYLRQNVRLLLEQAQLALLKSEPKLYQASLDKAIELVEGYYATDNDGVTNSIDKLKSLRDNEVRPELPDISESSQLLKRFIEQRFGNGSGNQGGNGSQNGGSQNGGAQGGTSGSAQGEGA
ncbi:uroporphyrinogen-III C-methyltransferase [Salinicola salarius]|uniref:uroporphyrinogen-III C-methyltransferase n=1 Tax=Salinicola salarius TaxID=430457 RepID=UPI0023E3597B|nr:uroporphyrinogen-III C-methyltransferase [Salinicola salarius]MDF3917965.1 uroporphyrinogen-III C-methyltransferase [Salinicola salarius]